MATIFYHAGALGDFISILPAAAAWRSTHPGEKTVLFGKPAFGEIARLSGYFDEVWNVESAACAWLFSGESPIPPAAAAAYAAFDTAIVFADRDSPVPGRMICAGVKSVHVQPPFPDRRMPVALYHASLLPDGIGNDAPSYAVISPHGDHRQEALSLLGGLENYVCIHPGSGSAVKNWPHENFKALSRACERSGCPVVWVIGEAEFDMPERAGDLPGSLILRSLPLPILVHVLSGSSAYIGNDSGISHLAGATGCGCVVLFGPSDEVVWAPRGKKVTILKAPRPCSPCHPFKNGIAHPCSNPCMRDISVEEVVDAVRRIIEQKNAVRG